MQKQRPLTRYWLIEGYDSTKQIFEDRVPLGALSDRQAEELLRRLACKAGLSFREIVNASVKRGTRRHSVHLEVHRDSGPRHFHLTCGDNPWFVASVRSETHGPKPDE